MNAKFKKYFKAVSDKNAIMKLNLLPKSLFRLED